jgi:hypothetical protein
MLRKRIITITLIASFPLMSLAPAEAANKAGGTCTTLKSIAKIGSSKYECKINSKTKKAVWTKLVKPKGFDCVKSKKALPMLKDSFNTLQDYFETIALIYPAMILIILNSRKTLIDQSTSDLKLLEDSLKKYC